MNKSVEQSVSELDLTNCAFVTLGVDNSENNYQKQDCIFSGRCLSKVTDKEVYFWESLEQLNTSSDEKFDANAKNTTTQFLCSVSERSSNPFSTVKLVNDKNPFRCASNSNPFKEASLNSFSSARDDDNEVMLPRINMEVGLSATNPFKNCVENEFNYECQINSSSLLIDGDSVRADTDVKKNSCINQTNELCVGIETDDMCFIKRVTVTTASFRKSESGIYDNVNALIGGDEIVKIKNCYLNQLTYSQCETLLKMMTDTTEITIKRQNLTSNANEPVEFTEMDVSTSSFTKLIITKETEDYNPQDATTLENTFLLDRALLFQRGDAQEEDVPIGFTKLTVVIQKNADEHLGVSIVPSYGATRELYQIKRLLPEGACAKSGHIEIGDRLLTCNGFHLKNLTQTQCLDILRHSNSPLNLTVLRQKENRHQNVHSEKNYCNDSLVSPQKEYEIESKAKYFDISINDKSLPPSNSINSIKEVYSECRTPSPSQSSPTVLFEKGSVTTSDKILKEKYDNQRYDHGKVVSLNFIHNDHRSSKVNLIKGSENFANRCNNNDNEVTQEVNDIFNDCAFMKNASEQLTDSFLFAEKEKISEETLPSLISLVKGDNDIIINIPSRKECLKSEEVLEAHNLFEIIDSQSSCAFMNGEKTLNHIATSQYTTLMLDQESSGKLTASYINPYLASNILKMDSFPSPPVNNEKKSIGSMQDVHATINPLECENKCTESTSNRIIAGGNILSEIKDVSVPEQNVQLATSTQALKLYQCEEKEISNNGFNTNDNLGEEALRYKTFGENTVGQEEEIPIRPMTAIKDSNGNSLCIPSPITERICLQNSRMMDQDAKEEIAIIMAGFGGLKPQIKDETSQVPHCVIDEDEIVPTILNQNQKEIVTDILKKWQNTDSHKNIIERAASGFIRPVALTILSRDYDNFSIFDKDVAKASFSKTQINETAAFQDSLKSDYVIKENISEVIGAKSNEDASNAQLSLKFRKDFQNSNKDNDTEERPETLENRDYTGREYKTIATSGLQTVLENFGKTLDPFSLNSTPKRPQSMIEDSYQHSSTPLTSLTTEDTVIPAFKFQRSSIANFLPNGRPSSGNFTGVAFAPKVKTDYPKTRQDDGKPFQVDVLKGITGLGIKVTINVSGYAQVSDIQRGGPIDKNGQIRVNDYLWSINSTELTGQSDAKVQQVLRLLPRGLVKIVVSSPKSIEMEENISNLRGQKESQLFVSSRPHIFPSSTYISLQKSQTEKTSLDLTMTAEPEMPLAYPITDQLISGNAHDPSSTVLPKDSSLNEKHSLPSVDLDDLSSLADEIPKNNATLNKIKEQSVPQKFLPIKDETRKCQSDDNNDEPDNGNVCTENINTNINVDVFSIPKSTPESISKSYEESFQLKLSPALTPNQNTQIVESDVSIFRDSSVAPGASQLTLITKEDRKTFFTPKIPPPVAPKPQSSFRMTAKSDDSGDIKSREQLLKTSQLITSKNDSPKLFTQSVRDENVTSSKAMVASQVRKFDKPCFIESKKSTPLRTIESSKVETKTLKKMPVTPSIVSTNYKSLVTSAIRPKDNDIFDINRELSDSKTIRVLSPSRLNSALSPRISPDSPTSPTTKKFAVIKNTRSHSYSFVGQDQMANEASSDNVTKGSFDYDIDTSPQNTQKSVEMVNEQNNSPRATNDKINYNFVDYSDETYGQFSDNFKKEEKGISNSFSTSPLSPMKTSPLEKNQDDLPHTTLHNKKPVALPRKKKENKKPLPDQTADNGFFQLNQADNLLIDASLFSQISNDAPLLDSPIHSIKFITGSSDFNKSFEVDLQEENSEKSMNTSNNENLSNLLLVAEKETRVPLGTEKEDDIYVLQAKQIVEQVISNVFSDKYILKNTVKNLDILYQGFSEAEPPPLPEAPPPNIKNSEHHVLLEKLYPNLDLKIETLPEFRHDQNMKTLASGEHNDELVIINESLEPLIAIEKKEYVVDNGIALMDMPNKTLDMPNETLHIPTEDTFLKETVENINLSGSNENDTLENKNDASRTEHEMIVNTINEEFDSVPFTASNVEQMMSNIHGEIQNAADSEKWVPPPPTTAPPVLIAQNCVNDNTVICHETILAVADVNVLSSYISFYNDEISHAEEIVNCSPIANEQSRACDLMLQKGVESCDRESVNEFCYASQYQKEKMEDCRSENVEEPIENELLTLGLQIKKHIIQDDIKQVADLKDILFKNSLPAKNYQNTAQFVERSKETYVQTAAQPENETGEQLDSFQKSSQKEEILKVVMVKGATGVGLCLEGGKGSPKGNLPITIKRIFKGGPAEKCGKLKVKDEIIEVNGVDFTTMRHYEAWNHLKFLDDGDINITIKRH